MRSLAVILAIANLPLICVAQDRAVPAWPQVKLDNCPAISIPGDRKWKHGDAEQRDFWTAVQTKDTLKSVGLLQQFAEQYPDSDYLEPALLGEWAGYVALKDAAAQVRAAEAMVNLPSAEATIRVTAFVTLASDLSPYVLPNDPQKERQLADLDKWVQCGGAALVVEVKPSNVSEESFLKRQQYEQSVLDRTEGFVALMRANYVVAQSNLDAARKLNSGDALTYLWLASAELLSTAPDSNKGIFYLARATELVPQTPGASPSAGQVYEQFLKQMYVMVHGSEKGLSDLRNSARVNTDVPAGFNVLRKPKVKHHYGAAVATAAIAALLIYGAASHPETMQAIGQSLGQPSQERKLMVFGGPGHRAYLGCLSCSEIEMDSVFNSVGPHGSAVASESIWNTVSEYGSQVSPYSACNQVASDPPVIVDQDGIAYGRLTVNSVNPNIGVGARFQNWLTSEVCQN